MGVSRTFPLPYDAHSGFTARRYVETFAAEEKLEDDTVAMSIIVSELVTNAVVHGKGPVELTLRHERGEVTVEVADADPRLPNVRTPDDHEHCVGGKGLLIVGSLADRWGTRLSDRGKTVWAAIRTANP